MGERSFDPIALVIGLVFVAAGTVVLLGGSLLEDGRFLVPTGLIALGVALLVSGRTGEDGASDEVRSESGEDGQI